jgi:hypothetical protein
MNSSKIDPDELTHYARQTLCQAIEAHIGAECRAYQEYIFLKMDGINAVLCNVFWCRLNQDGFDYTQIGFNIIIGMWMLQTLLNQQNDLHWLKVFLGQSGGQFRVECQFNNEERPELSEILRTELMWPARRDENAMLSVKQYLVIVPG